MRNTLAENKKVGFSAKDNVNSFFDTEYLKADLKGRSVRGGAVTIAAQGAKFFLQMGSTVILARLLTPEDYGLIAMVAVVTNFVMMFKDMGLSMATIQKAEVNHGQISTLFWINVFISLIIMSIMAALAPVVAWFYGKPELTLVTLALAGTFIFGGLTIQHQALLRRQMRFGTLAVVGIISMSVGIIAALIAAWYEAGYWALVIMQLATAIADAIAVWVACGWRPGLPVRRSGVRKMLAFGGNLTGFNIVNYFARNADNLLIGKFWGSGQLGLYSKAYGLLLLPLGQVTGPITSVAIPALSRLQNEPQRYRNYYLKAIYLIAFITMPGVMFMIVMSKDIIHLVLGDQWIGAAKIFSILGVSALLQPVLSTNGWLHVSVGRTDRMLRWGVIAVPAIVVSFVIGLPFGAVGVATSYTICMLLLAIPCLWYACIPTPVTLLSIVNVLWRIMLATVMSGIVLIVFRLLFATLFSGVTGLAISFTIIAILYVGIYCALEWSVKSLREIIRLFREIR